MQNMLHPLFGAALGKGHRIQPAEPPVIGQVQQRAAVGLARFHIRRAHHPLVAGLLQISAINAVDHPQENIEPVHAQRQPGDQLGPLIPRPQVGTLMGQDMGAFLRAQARHQIDAGTEISHCAGRGDAVGHIDAFLLFYRKA